MNKSKRPMANKLRKKMTKEIRLAQASYPVPKARMLSDELTTKEMLKRYPKKTAKKQAGLLETSTSRVVVKKKKHQKKHSKRTTPGTVASDSSPAFPQKEGLRWIKTLTKQTLAQRAIQAHQGKKKK
jgi:hypothetical protein